MKKSLALLLAGVMILGTLTGCGTEVEETEAVKGSIGEELKNTIADAGTDVVEEIKVDDPASYWKEHADEIWYGGQFVIFTDNFVPDSGLSMHLEADGDDYTMFQLAHGDQLFVAITSGDTNYVAFGDEQYRFPLVDQAAAETTINVDEMQSITSRMVYKESVDAIDVFHYVGDDEEFDISLSRETGGVVSLNYVTENILLTVQKLQERTYSDEDLAAFTDIPEDKSGEEFVMGAIMSMMLVDNMEVDPATGENAFDTVEDVTEAESVVGEDQSSADSTE